MHRPQVPEALRELPGPIQRYMVQQGFEVATPCQQRAWPLLIKGENLLAIAPPGSGKTLAYVLPAALLMEPTPADKGEEAAAAGTARGPLALVVVPTRELAQQVLASCRPLQRVCGMRSVAVHGGTDRSEQAEQLRERPPHLVVGTPGRLLDLMATGELPTAGVRYVALDEADKMLAPGNVEQLEALRQALIGTKNGEVEEPVKKKGKEKKKGKGEAAAAAGGFQCALFTATLTADLERHAAAWLGSGFQRVEVELGGELISPTVTQVVHVCAEHKKPRKLLKHLEAIKQQHEGSRNPPRILIFTNRIRTCRFVFNSIKEAGYRTGILHGDRSQEERDAAMQDFRGGKVQVHSGLNGRD